MAGDYTGALLSTSLGLGQVLGPLFGATAYAKFGFRVTQDIVAIVCIVFALLYFFFAEGYLAFKMTFSKRDSLGDLDNRKGVDTKINEGATNDDDGFFREDARPVANSL
mmetsp:Transcript_27687/g.36973  ORF Transcript_27687/g.36973 Transcript_27687/m.36973 type:complete len:109 (-) Transcript_27687:157-483(-)